MIQLTESDVSPSQIQYPYQTVPLFPGDPKFYKFVKRRLRSDDFQLIWTPIHIGGILLNMLSESA